jgi:CubicO group peptidase (beta-lactamase class C family)
VRLKVRVIEVFVLLAAAFWSRTVEAQVDHTLIPRDLVGVWGDKRVLGPEVRGVLTVECVAESGRAEIGGRLATIHRHKDSVTFELANGQGRFRGKIENDRILGHWIQPRTIAYGTSYATPVRLSPIGPKLWQGEVRPLDDAMTSYMVIQYREDSTLTAYFRNPQRNAGRLMNVDHLVLDGNNVSFVGPSSGSGPGTVVASGVYNAEGECLSVYLPGLGGTYDFSRSSAAQLGGFSPRGKQPEPYSYHPPLLQPDGWPVAALEDVGISPDTISQFIQMLIDMPMESLHTIDIHGVLMARHGKLVLEEYFHGFNRNELHDTRSASKTITSTLTGAAILKGLPITTSTPVYETMRGAVTTAGFDPRKKALTVEHLLTMSSGLDCDDSNDDSPGNEDRMQEQTQQPDWIVYTLDLDMIREPGEKSVYCSCNPNLLGGVLSKATGQWLPDLFHELIAKPLQIRQYAINLMPTGDAYMGGGMRLLPRDFMKVGQLMMDGGRWNGQQVVGSDWAKQATSKLVKVEDRDYGYFWWVVDYPYKGDSVTAFFAGGNGGQIVMGIPGLDLVIAFYCGNYSDRVSLVPQQIFVPKYILPAVN